MTLFIEGDLLIEINNKILEEKLKQLKKLLK